MDVCVNPWISVDVRANPWISTYTRNSVYRCKISAYIHVHFIISMHFRIQVLLHILPKFLFIILRISWKLRCNTPYLWTSADFHIQSTEVHGILREGSPQCWGYVKTSSYWGKEDYKFWIRVIWTKVNEWPWPLVLIKLHVPYLFSCLHLPTFISQTTIISEKIHCFNFFPYKSTGDHIWPCHKNRSVSTEGHHLNNLGSTCTWVLDAACFKIIDLLVPEILKVC